MFRAHQCTGTAKCNDSAVDLFGKERRTPRKIVGVVKCNSSAVISAWAWVIT